MMKAEPGDTIVIDWPSNGDLHGVECEVVKGTKGIVAGTEDRIWLKHPGVSHSFWLLPHHVRRVDRPIDNMAEIKPGDTIAITDPSYGSLNGIHCTVVKDDLKPMSLKDTPGCIRVASPYLDYPRWLLPGQYSLVQQSSSVICSDCKGTGRIKLFTSTVDCDCKKTKSVRDCDECSYEFCECDGLCNLDVAGACGRCGVWCCSGCLMDGTCGSCYAKIQGGVN